MCVCNVFSVICILLYIVHFISCVRVMYIVLAFLRIAAKRCGFVCCCWAKLPERSLNDCFMEHDDGDTHQ